MSTPTTLGAMENQPLHGGTEELLGRALVVVVDDRVSRGESSDTIGPLVTELLGEAGLVVDGTIVVPGRRSRSATRSTPR